jgi:uncharacterized DUF497 family protein
MKIVWDEPKRQANLERHGFDLALIAKAFVFERAVIVPTRAGKRGEARYLAIGEMERKLLTVVFARLGTEGLSLISARAASKKERKIHEKRQTQTGLARDL